MRGSANKMGEGGLTYFTLGSQGVMNSRVLVIGTHMESSKGTLSKE